MKYFRRLSISTTRAMMCVIALVMSTYFLYAFSNGITGLTRKDGTGGCTCHGTASSSVTVSITGPDSLAINTTGTYNVTITGGPAVRGGTDIAASDGDLNPVSSELSKFDMELTHQSPAAFSNGSLSFEFTYTAPGTPGIQTIYANGNSVNFNGSSTGDAWNFAPDKSVTIVNNVSDVVDQESGLPRLFTLAQNYPNPFNPITTIVYEIPNKASVRLQVFDILGQLVATLVDRDEQVGKYSVKWDASSRSSGVYYYRLIAGEFTQTKKMVLLK